MVDISSQNNKINVTVSSSGNTANTNVTPDYAQYYSEKSKEWAISDRIVDNIDYSSKYYAGESKKQADISTAKATEVVESGNNAVTNIENARDNAITDITNQEGLSVDNVNTAGATQVTNVNSAGTTQINLAKEQVTLATNQANIATDQATIATNKTSEVVESGNEALSNIDTAKNNAITTITTQETTSKNNVIATGNEQVDRIIATGNSYDNLTHRNITNCLTEVPQMIKADIVDGTLTVYAGSKCIVPYGTDAPTYSIGDFLLGEANNNLYKIVDIQYDPTDVTPQLFYWCELQRDVSQTAPVTSSTMVTRLVALNISGELNSAGEEIPFVHNAKSWSQDTLPTDKNAYQWYQPTNNKCVNVNTSHVVSYAVQSFPILKVLSSTTQVYGSIIQTFDSMGYIGLLRWYDKSLAGLAPNGFNTDGSYNNVIANPIGKLVTINSGAAGRVYIDRLDANSNIVGARQYQYTREVENFSQVLSLNIDPAWCVYVKNLNKIFINENGQWGQSITFYASEVRINTDGVIEDFAPCRAFRVADANELDGKWTMASFQIFNNLSFKADQERTYDLSQYLPDDNNVYEVLFFCFGRTGTTSGNTISIWLGSSVCPNTVICANQTRTTSYMYGSNSLTIPIGQDKVLKVSALNQIGTATNVGLQMKVYRKVR